MSTLLLLRAGRKVSGLTRLLILLLCLASLSQANAQTVTIGSTAVPVVAPATSSYLYGPIYRSSATSTFNYSKYAHVYTAAELGIPAGSIITNIEWLKSDGGTITGNNTFEIYLKNTVDPTLATGTTWGTLVAGATQAYASTTQEFLGAAGTYISFPTAGANFVYTGGNLLVMTDHVKNGTATGAVNFVTNPATGQGIGAASGTALTSATTLNTGSYGNRRPTIKITYMGASPCAGTPAPGNTVASQNPVCPGANFTLSPQNITMGSGVTYQWQSSSDGVTYTNVGGGNPSFSTSQLAAAYYQLIVTCNGVSTTTTPVLVNMSSFLTCYCSSNATSTADEELFNVTFGSLSNSSTCTTTAPGPGSLQSQYSNYTGLTPPSVMQTQVVPFSIEVGTCGAGSYSNSVAMYIDFNQNGLLTDPGEEVYISAATTVGAHIESGFITIPANAVPGNTLMRVIVEETTPANLNPCGTFTWGETEDYYVNIVAATNCAGTPTPGTITSSVSNICAGSDFNLSLTGQTIGVGIGIQWQVSSDGINFTNISGANASLATVSQLGTSYYRAEVTCNSANPAYSNVLLITSPGLFPGGVYTINSAVATGGTNFQSFTAAVDAIECGIAGAVTFNVIAGSGPYTEQITIPQVFGASATSRITFNGNGETITFASSNSSARHVIQLNGADYVTFDDLVVDASTGTYGWGIHLTDEANYNEILNSTITVGISSTSTNFGALIASGSNTSATTSGNAANYTLIQGNTIIGGYYTLTMMGESTASPSVGNQIINNTVEDGNLYQLYLYYQNGMVVRGNDISRPNRTSLTTFYGIYMFGHQGVLVENNRVHDPFTTNTSSTSLVYGIYLSGSDVATGPENEIRNNLIYDIESNGTIYAIYNSSSGGTNYYHNTISLDYTASTGGTTRAFYAIGTSSSPIEFVNNIISLTRGGTGTKHLIYISSATNPVVSNNNVLYLNAISGTNHIGYNGANQTTLGDWQAAGYDLNSTAENPMFTNPATGDYTPTSQFADNIGTPVGVLLDITGATRSTTFPDPGAYEFSVFVACPAAVGLNATILNSVSAELSWNIATTLGDFTVEYGPVGFTLGNGTQISALSSSPFLVTGLTPGTCYQFYVQQDCGIAGLSVMSGPQQFCMPVCAAGTIAGASSFCYSGTPTLSIPTATQQSTFQWQESSSATGPFTNIAGATASTYTASAPITTTTYYQVVMDCGTGPMTTPVFTIEVSSPLITSTNTPVTLCAPGVANLTAAASAGDVKWFDVATGGTALATGTTYSPTVTANTTYYAAAVTGTPPTSHTTTFAAGNGSNGNMFPITALNTVTILSFAGHTTSGTSDWQVWYRPDNYLLVPGANTSSTGWTLLGTANGVVSAGTGNPTPIPIPVNITIPAGMTYSFQVVTVGGTTVQYTNGTTVGNVFNANSDFQFIEGHGGSVNSMTFAPRVFNGVINYSSGCESARVPVEVFVTPVDPITVSATPSTICEGETVTLSVTNPQAGVAYTWMPGSIVGATATVTPTATTSYTVTGGNAGGCSATETVSVTVNPAPVVTAGSNSPVTLGGTISLTATGGTSYSWVGPNSFTSTDQNPTITAATPAASGNYTVYGSNANCTSMAVVSVTVAAPQPLNGTYTINQTAPASATNFVSFTTAADFLNTLGVSGPVIINVVASTSPYLVQQFLLDEIPGSSATNTVTINGNGEVINFCGNVNNRDIIRLNGTDNININGLVLNAVCNYGWGIHLMGDIDNVTFANNTINLQASSSMLIGSMNGILASNSMFNPQAPAGMMTNLTVTGNTINNGYHGIRLEAATNTLGTGVVVSNNTILGSLGLGVDVRNMSAPTVTQNMVTMGTGGGYISQNSIGVVLVNTENGMTVTRNRVINAGTMGMYLLYANRTTTTRGLVANNMMGGGFQNMNMVHAVQLNFASYLDVDYNSTLADNGAIGSGMYVSNQFSTQLMMRNNSFAYTGSGAGYALQANNGFSNFLEIDNNNYYSPGAKFVRFSGMDRMDMAQVQQGDGPLNHNMQSISANPMYVSTTDLHLQSGSPLIGMGMTLAGVTLDYDGGTRTTPTDIGADEFGVQLRQQATTLDAEVYPNPFQNNLTVKLTSTEAGNVQVVLSDLMGRQIMSRSYTAEAGITELAVSVEQQLSQGVYLLQVTQGEVTSTFRVVKQ